MKQVIGTVVVLALLVSLTAPSAQASLIGDTVQIDMQPTPPWTASPGSAVVGAGPESAIALGGLGDFFEVDIDAASILLNYVNEGSLSMNAGEVLTISDLDWIGNPGAVAGFSLTVNGSVTGFDASDISFTADSFTINLNGSDWEIESSALIEIQVRHAEVVPEPASAALGLMGLAGLMLRRRQMA